MDAFWQLTLREVEIVQRGVAMRNRRVHDELAWAVWHIVSLPRAKKIPDLGKLTSKGEPRRVVRQSWRTQEALFAAWG